MVTSRRAFCVAGAVAMAGVLAGLAGCAAGDEQPSSDADAPSGTDALAGVNIEVHRDPG